MAKEDKVKRSIAQYWKGAPAYAAILARENAGKRNFTNSAVSNGRAEICAGCPHNKKPGKITATVDALILKQAGGRKTRFDDRIFNCAACSCPLKLLVHLSVDLLRITKDPIELRNSFRAREKSSGKPIPANCWQARKFNLKLTP